MKTSSIALFDMDDSVADHLGKIICDLNDLASPEEPALTKENFYERGKISHIRKRMIVIRQQNNWWSGLAPIQMGLDALKTAQEIGYDIHILTKGPRYASIAWKEKVEWCQEHIDKGMSIKTNIHITSDKSLVYGRFLYDDYPEYMENWLRSRPRGLGIMPVMSYNKDFHHPNVFKWDGNNIEELKRVMKMAFDRKSGTATDYRI